MDTVTVIVDLFPVNDEGKVIIGVLLCQNTRSL